MRARVHSLESKKWESPRNKGVDMTGAEEKKKRT